MKRLYSILLVALLLLSAPAIACAAEDEAPVSRGQWVLMLNQALGLYTAGGDGFVDVTTESSYYYELLAAQRAGYLSGYPDGSVKPEQGISRLEAAVMMDQLVTFPTKEKVNLSDEVPSWSAEQVQRICANGLLQLTERGEFRGTDILTQGEASQALAALKMFQSAPLWQETILNIPTYDGYSFKGRLCLPTNAPQVDKVVLYINGTGANTYLNKRESGPYRFMYFDYFADRFAEQNTAFFSYNTRGVDISEEAPFYTIDWPVYGTYTPQSMAKDVAAMVTELRKQPALKNAKIYLLGWSEGAITAPLAVVNEGVQVDGLLLAGYPNANMADILKWQLDGPQTYFLYTIYCNAIGQDGITKAQYEADPYGVMETMFGNVSFADTDTNGNGLIDVEDFAGNVRAQMHQRLLQAVKDGDDNWIRENFMDLPAMWFTKHFELGSTEDILVQIEDIPIHIFHGTYDLNCPVQGVYDVQARFKELGKNNLTVHIFDAHNHDLNYDYWLLTNADAEGCQAIFDTVQQLGNQS